MAFFTELQQNFFYKLYENTQIPKAILRKKNGVGEIKFPDLSLYFKATVVKMVRYYQKNRRKKNRSVEQDRGPRDKPKYLWSPSQ